MIIYQICLIPKLSNALVSTSVERKLLRKPIESPSKLRAQAKCARRCAFLAQNNSAQYRIVSMEEQIMTNYVRLKCFGMAPRPVQTWNLVQENIKEVSTRSLRHYVLRSRQGCQTVSAGTAMCATGEGKASIMSQLKCRALLLPRGSFRRLYACCSAAWRP